jgi:hypothetical protein
MLEAEPTNADAPKRKRRWFQFSLRTLLVGVTLLAAACGYVGWQAKIVRQRQTMLFRNPRFGMMSEQVADDGESGVGLSWIRRCLGDKVPGDIIAVDDASDAELDEYRTAFPEADHILRKSDLQKLDNEIYGPGETIIFPR